jgi:hypothetical protein
VPIAVGVIWIVTHHIRERHFEHDQTPPASGD